MPQTHCFCSLCFSFNVFRNYPELFNYIYNEHREGSSFSIRYELSVLCESRYSSFDSYRCYIYRCHRSLIDPSESDNTISSNIDDDLFISLDFNGQPDSSEDSESFIYPDEAIDETNNLQLNLDPISSSVTDKEFGFDKLTEFYAHFLPELREYHLLPRNVV